MAADGVNKLKLQLIHGQQKHDVILTLRPEEAGDVLTVAHLAVEVERLTGVPQPGQKLICKGDMVVTASDLAGWFYEKLMKDLSAASEGKSLKEPTASLKSLGLKDGSKIMVIGKKLNVEEDENMQKMRLVEGASEKLNKKLSDIIYEVRGIHEGFLAKHLQEESLQKLTKRLRSCVEEYTRLLETLDGLSLGQSAHEIRTKRKMVVAKIQGSLESCDREEKEIEQLVSKLKS